MFRSFLMVAMHGLLSFRSDKNTNTTLLGISKEVAWIFLDVCHSSILIKKFLIKVAIT